MNCDGCGVDVDVDGHSVCPRCGSTSPLTIRGPRLPDEPWELTAPESYLLRYDGLDGGALPVSAFKLALTDLVARSALTLKGAWIPRRWAPGKYPMFLLGDGPRKASVDELALVPIIALHTRMIERRPSFGIPFDDPTDEVSGVPLDKFVSAAARHNGGYSAYLTRDVAGSLRNRNLLSSVNRRTAAGVRASRQLDAWMEVGRGPLKHWMHDQTWLGAYLAGAGAAVFLTSMVNPGTAALHNIGRASVCDPGGMCDPGGIEFAVIADSLDGVFGAFDAAFLGGGGGGDGGGGGGGDGGGGGGGDGGGGGGGGGG